MAEYKTPANRGEGEFTEKKSRFIGHVAPVQTEEEAVAFIEEIRQKNREARHNVFAYVLKDGAKRISDDGEPQGTGGVQLLGVLEGAALTNACMVVTRYFGGILLGAGPLARAYGHGARLALENTEIATMALSADYSITLPYELYGIFEHHLADMGVKILGCTFEENVCINVRMIMEETERFLDNIRELSSGAVTPKLIKTGWDRV